MAEPVDLEEEDAGRLAAQRLATPAELASHDLAVPVVVLVDGEQTEDAGADRREDDRHHRSLQHALDLGARQDVDREGHEDAVEQEPGEAEGEDRERQREAHEQRQDERVEEADQRRGAERVGGAVEDEAVEPVRQEQQRAGVQEEDEQAPPETSLQHRARV